jgi:predicted TIM-barrel fold metal-dependent hydrolase
MIKKLVYYGRGFMISKHNCHLYVTEMVSKKNVLKRSDMKDGTATAGIQIARKKFLMLFLSGIRNGSNSINKVYIQLFNHKGKIFSRLSGNLILYLILLLSLSSTSNAQIRPGPAPGYDLRIKNYIDSLKIVDTHEHLFDPELIKNSSLTDFMLLLHHYNFSDFVSAGLNPGLFNALVDDSLTVTEKWKIVKPFWEGSFNTTYNRIALLAANRLFGIDDINIMTIGPLSEKIRIAYKSDWFRQVINDKCGIECFIQDGHEFKVDGVKIYNVKRFSPWLTVRTKYTVDSIAVMQISPVKTLEDFVKSLETSFKRAVDYGIVAVKINIAYSRTLNFEDVKIENARKVFRSIMDGEEGQQKSWDDTKPLQDFMLFRLLDLAKKYKLPVAFHTGLMSGSRNSIKFADPTLLTNLFKKYPDVKFVLFHGSYPYGGELGTIVKNFSNVYMDLSWIYAISPSYSERYLNEWIETVPAMKIMAFGGDFASCENTYGELIIAKQIITRVLNEKVSEGYFSEDEAKIVAKMILHDSAVKFYNLK